MITGRKITATLVGAVLTAAVLTGCGAATPDATPTPPPVVTTASTSAALADGDTTPTPTPTPAAPDPTTFATAAAGTTVPADQVEAARGAGAHVYVAPTGGDGVVVVAGQPLPEVVIEQSRAQMPATPPQVGARQLREYASGDATASDALIATNVPIVVVSYGGNIGQDGSLETLLYTAGVIGVSDYKSINGTLSPLSSREAALAQAQGLAATFGAQVVDLTS